MNEELINQIVAFCSRYYIWELVIIAITIGLTALLKLPIKKAAESYAEKYNVDKSYITWCIGFIPYFFSFGLVCLLFFYRNGWKAGDEEWLKRLIAEGAFLGTGAVGAYEFIKKLIQGAVAAHDKKVESKVEEKAKAAGVVEIYQAPTAKKVSAKKSKKAPVTSVDEETTVIKTH